MKQLALCLLLLALPFFAYAQAEALRKKTTGISFDSAARRVLAEKMADYPNDTFEGWKLATYRRWVEFWENRVCNDAPNDSFQLEPANRAMYNYMSQSINYCGSQGQFAGNWQCIGPHTSYYGRGARERQGRVDAVWADPDSVNIMLAASNSGGVWKTTDTGHHWYNITDGAAGSFIIPGTISVRDIAVNPNDKNIIYLALGIGGQTEDSWGYGLGLVYTEDGGQSWQADEDFNSQIFPANVSEDAVGKLAYYPSTNRLYAIIGNKLFEKISQSANWYDITPNGALAPGYRFTDLEFSKTHPNKFFVSTNAVNDVADIWVYTYGAASQLSHTRPASLDVLLTISDIEISVSDSIYLLQTARWDTDSLYRRLVKTASNSVNESVKKVGDYRYDKIHASPADENVIYASVGDVNRFYVSKDGGYTFPKVPGLLHDDGRCLFFHTATNGDNGLNDIIIAGTDGGVVMKRAGNDTFMAITGAGMVTSQFYGIANQEDAEDDMLVGGSQDNGVRTFHRDKVVQWLDMTGGDGFLAKFARNGARKYHTQVNFPAVLKYSYYDDTSAGGVAIDDVNDACGIGEFDACNNIQRPYFIDVYVGFRNVWRQTLNGTTWARPFMIDPLDAHADSIVRKVCDITRSESTGDTTYIAYRDQAGVNPTEMADSSNAHAKLFVSYNATTGTPPEWFNITPPIVEYNRINDIETDVNDITKLWLALGDVNWNSVNTDPDDMTNKMLYTPDMGQTWVDISRGLPALPINKVLLRKGTKQLFAGTDIGVFTCDFSQYNPDSTDIDGVNRSVRWTCFNQGMPPCVVTDMEFNYCAGKLRISTFGRGMWETTLDESTWSVPPGEVTHITSNTTWNTKRYLTGNVTVDSNCTLTITGNGTVIHMPRNGHITVKPGGKIIVTDSARITNTCDSCFWWGIVGEGRQNVAHTVNTTNHAIVEINNKAVLENARHAVILWDMLGGNGLKAGGMLRAEDAIFLNNKNSVSFGIFPHDNMSYLSNCVFEVNDDYKGTAVNYPFGGHAGLSDVRGVDFRGCKFYNRTTDLVNKGNGIGIASFNAGYNVLPFCTGTIPTPCATYEACEFIGFENAIFAAGSLGPTYTAYINTAVFDSNTVGVRVDHMNDVTVVNSNFNVGSGGRSTAPDTTVDCYYNVGIYSTDAKRFTIENNSFQGIANNNLKSVGTWTFEAGENNNDIYRCNFDDLDFASLAQGINGNGPDGLRYACNDYNDNDRSILVLGPELGIWGISGMQMYATTSGPTAVANQFSNTGEEDIINYGSEMLYGITFTTPTVYSPGGLFNAIPSSNNACAAHFDLDLTEDEYDSEVLGSLKSNWNSLNGLNLTAIADLKSELDGGNTASLLSSFSGRTIADSTMVYNALMTISPYVTQEVFEYVIEEELLGELKLVSLLGSNPVVIRNGAFFTFLTEDMTTPTLSDGSETLLADKRDDICSRTMDEARIAGRSAEMMWRAQQIILDAKLDSTGAKQGDLPYWYRKIKNSASYYDLVGYYVSIDDLTTAEAVLDSIPTLFNLSGDKMVYHYSYKRLFNLHESIISNGRNMYDLSEAEADTLTAISTTGHPHIASITVEWDEQLQDGNSVLNLDCGVFSFINEKAIPEQGENPQLYQLDSKSGSLIVSPNPANDIVYFTYDVPEAKAEMLINVTSVAGQVLKQFTVTDKKGTLTWDTKGVPAGTYMYKMSGKMGVIGTGKLVIVK